MHAVQNVSKNIIDSLKMNMAAYDDNMSFGQLLSMIMDDKKISIHEMVSISGLSESTIKRCRNDRTQISFETIIIICITLRLNIRQSLLLISKSGYYLNSSPKCCAYINIICLCSSLELTIEQCDVILQKSGFGPLKKANDLALSEKS